MNDNNLRIGTCSWKFESWEGLVYSGSWKDNYLKEYSRQFSTVEIDQWFWSLLCDNKVGLPRKDVVIGYAMSVPGSFRFSIKVPNSITLTHHYSRSKTALPVLNPNFLSVELMEQFLESLEPMRQNIGPLIFQFECFEKWKMASQQQFQRSFSQFIRDCPAEYDYCVEIRNPEYLNREYFEFLQMHEVYPVLLQGCSMPSIFDLYDSFRKYLRGILVVRLLGEDRMVIEQKSGKMWSRIVEPKDEDLNRLATMLTDQQLQGTQIYLNVNNHYEGSAPLTIERIRLRLGM